MITPLTPMEFKRRAMKLYANKVAVIDDSQSFTYRSFLERTNQLSNGLAAIGVESGTKVAVVAPNTHEMLECFYGVCQIGAILVPINYRLQPHEVEYILNHSDSEVLIVDSDYAHLLEPILASIPNVRHIVQIATPASTPLPHALDYEAMLRKASTSDPDVEIDENQPITINYTSGTTSKPKGVVLTHRNVYMNAVDFLFHLHVSYDDVYLHTLPMFHANGWGGVWALTGVGGTHVCLRKVDPMRVLDMYQEKRITLACGAPTVLNMLLQAPNVENANITWPTRIATAGSPPPAAVIERVQRLLNMDVIHVYGLTEVSPFITYCEWRSEFNALSRDEQAALKACQGVEMLFNGETTVVREDGSEVAWDGTEIGEIVTRGNVVMEGYYKQPEETEKAMRGGWFHSGDLAVIHPNGYIEILDRKKDVIISGGENVSSIEVEGVLYKHPGIADVAVVARPDEKWGEVPVAFVVLKPDVDITEEELNEFCRERLAHFKTPKEYRFVTELPRTATGKLQKFKIRETVWEGKTKKVQ